MTSCSVGDEGEDFHLGSTSIAGQGISLVDSEDELSPSFVRGTSSGRGCGSRLDLPLLFVTNGLSVDLPESSAEVIVTIRAYHHFTQPEKTLASIRRALRPEGRFVVIESERIKGISDERRLEHIRAGKGTFTDEVVDAGFRLRAEVPLFKEDVYFLVFEKR